MLCEGKMLMITHNTMLQGEYVNDNLHNNASTRNHEEDIDNEMQSKKLRIQVCEWTNKNKSWRWKMRENVSLILKEKINTTTLNYDSMFESSSL